MYHDHVPITIKQIPSAIWQVPWNRCLSIPICIFCVNSQPNNFALFFHKNRQIEKWPHAVAAMLRNVRVALKDNSVHIYCTNIVFKRFAQKLCSNKEWRLERCSAVQWGTIDKGEASDRAELWLNLVMRVAQHFQTSHPVRTASIFQHFQCLKTKMFQYFQPNSKVALFRRPDDDIRNESKSSDQLIHPPWQSY